MAEIWGWIKAATRAVKFEEKLWRLEGVRKEYVRFTDLKIRDRNAERERLEFPESRGWSDREWERRRKEGEDTWMKLERVGRDIRVQEIETEIWQLRYARALKENLLEKERPKFLEGLKDRKKKEIKSIARFRFGCETRGTRYWMGKDG